jgi:hypothetical protein
MGAENPEGLEEDVYEILWQEQNARKAEKLLAETLLEAVQATAQEEEKTPLGKTAGAAATIGSMAFDLASQLCFQWNKVDVVALEVRRLDGSEVVAIEVNVKPGKKIVLKGPHIASPAITIQGNNRIVIQPDAHDPGRTEIVFAGDEGGEIEIGFKGIVYLLSRIFFIPFDNATLEEVRTISRAEPPYTTKSATLVLMRATKKENDRRIIQVEISKKPVFKERVDLPPLYEGDERTILFQYYNEEKAYFLESESFEGAGLK